MRTPPYIIRTHFIGPSVGRFHCTSYMYIYMSRYVRHYHKYMYSQAKPKPFISDYTDSMTMPSNCSPPEIAVSCSSSLPYV